MISIQLNTKTINPAEVSVKNSENPLKAARGISCQDPVGWMNFIDPICHKKCGKTTIIPVTKASPVARAAPLRPKFRCATKI